MYRIGEFSTLSKTTIKTLRYYEKVGLLKPAYVDKDSSYRYYETKDLLKLAKIVSLRQIGVSIENIKRALLKDEFVNVLVERKKEIEEELLYSHDQLSKINCLLEGKDMKYEAIVKELPECIVYFKKGIVKDYSAITEFILSSGEECRRTNPTIKCLQPDYCFVNYLDGEFKEKDISIRYVQAVTEMGIPNETIQFEQLKSVKAVCVYHKGTYENLGQAYSFIMKWIEDNNYEIVEAPRECYIDGIWNKENVEDWVTEIQFPIR